MNDLMNKLEVNLIINPSKSEEKSFKKEAQHSLNMTPEQVDLMLNKNEDLETDNNDGKKKDATKFKVTSFLGGVKNRENKKFLSLIHGDYCKHVFVNDNKIWDIRENITSRPSNQISNEDLLPSDCRFRIDRGMLIENEMDFADDAKSLIEELQRHDYKLRDSVPKSKKNKHLMTNLMDYYP